MNWQTLSKMENKKIVLLGGKGLSTNIVFNNLNDNFGIHTAIIENPVSRKKLIKGRIKRLGIIKVFGQLIFQVCVTPLLGFLAKNRKKEIIETNALNTASIPDSKIEFVNSVNDKKTIELLQQIKPDLIIVNGTRIISKKVLESVPCDFINTHAGITPKYRGVHGTYWALVNNDLKNSGVTVHFVDTGIDTGIIIYQETVTPTPKDNFTTYPLLQISEGLKILNKAIVDYFGNTISIKKNQLESHLWYHPSVFQYLYFRIKNNVK